MLACKEFREIVTCGPITINNSIAPMYTSSEVLTYKRKAEVLCAPLSIEDVPACTTTVVFTLNVAQNMLNDLWTKRTTRTSERTLQVCNRALLNSRRDLWRA